MTTLLALWITISGVVAFIYLPVSALPKVEFPTIQVTANLPGAKSETMAEAVALPLEQRFAAIDGLDNMSSSSAQGTSRITLQFSLDKNIDAAAQDVGTAISAAQAVLPPNMPSLPTYKKINPSDTPVIYLALTSKTLPLWQVNEYADTYVSNRLSMQSGVAQVEILGEQKYAVRIYAKPDLLAVRKLSLKDVATAIQKANINPATGSLDGLYQSQIINPDTIVRNAKEFSKLIVSEKDGKPVRIKDIGEAVDDVDNNKIASWFNHERAIVVAVSKQPGSNTIDVVKEIKNILPSLREQLPPSVSLEVIIDRSLPIVESIKDVERTFLVTAILVVLVIFVFLCNVRATIIPSVTVPLAIVATFILMSAFGFSLNNLTLLALTLSIGFIVDDAIVVLENITRHVEQGLSPLKAAFKGTKEISFTIISMTLSLSAVFIPILLMPGIVGRLMHEFAITIIVVILMSGIISLTITPMMCRYFLTTIHQESDFWLYKHFKDAFEWLTLQYHGSLNWVMKRQKQTLIVSFLVLILNVFLYIGIPKGFFPNEDTGILFASTEAGPEISFSAMKTAQLKVMEIIGKDPNVEGFTSSIGASSTTLAQNQGRVVITLKPTDQRQMNAEQVTNSLREKLSKIPDINVFIQTIQNLRVGGISSKSQYQYTLQGQVLEELNNFTKKFEETLKKKSGFLDVTSDLQLSSLQIKVNIDRDHAARLGVSVEDIANTINLAYGDQQISTIYTELNTYQVILDVEQDKAQTLADLKNIYVNNNTGDLIPLNSLATFTRTNAPLTVNHLNRLPSATISFNLQKGVSIGDAVEAIKDGEREINLPPTIVGSFQGSAQAFQSSQKGQIWLLLAAIITIYVVLGMLYESYIHPLTILSGLPSAGIGALVALLVAGLDLDVIGFIGIIMLIGIVKKNAIMMIDYALDQQRNYGKTPEEAIIEACHRRFRPIMMTTMAAIIGSLPIALGIGVGAEIRQPLGVCVVGGLLISQILTLYVTPVFYLWLDQLSIKSVNER